jgi:nitrogen-specific signal transduction histidine kinase
MDSLHASARAADPRVDRAPVAVLTVAADGRIHAACPGAAALFGRAPGGLVGARVEDLVLDGPARVSELLALSPKDEEGEDDAVLSSLVFRTGDSGAPLNCIVRVTAAGRSAEADGMALLRVEVRYPPARSSAPR